MRGIYNDICTNMVLFRMGLAPTILIVIFLPGFSVYHIA